MSNPSPKAHLLRLAALLVAALVVFVTLKTVLTPASWNYENWHRDEALPLNASYALAYGGNASCVSCHQDLSDEMAVAKHQALSCESCHGALADHVKDDVKIGDAHVDDETTWQCLNCHEAMVNKPKGFPQFDKATVQEHAEMEDGMLCIDCHAAHDPTP